MAKPEWGIKRICPHCDTRYYDFCKIPPVCPSCKGIYDAELTTRSSKNKNTDEDSKGNAKTMNAEDLLLSEDDDDAGLDSSSNDLLEDTSELDTDDSDLDIKLDEE